MSTRCHSYRPSSSLTIFENRKAWTPGSQKVERMSRVGKTDCSPHQKDLLQKQKLHSTTVMDCKDMMIHRNLHRATVPTSQMTIATRRARQHHPIAVPLWQCGSPTRSRILHHEFCPAFSRYRNETLAAWPARVGRAVLRAWRGLRLVPRGCCINAPSARCLLTDRTSQRFPSDNRGARTAICGGSRRPRTPAP